MKRMPNAVARVAAAFALVLVLAPAPALAIEPDALPEALWWRSARETSLDARPLETLRTFEALALDVEWAPLYRGADGRRIERERRSLRVAAGGDRVRAALELGVQGSWARGGDNPWWLTAERPITTSGSFGGYLRGERFEGAASLTTVEDALGVAAGVRAQLAPRALATLSLSRLPRAGRTYFRLNEDDVLAHGRWIERRQEWSLEIGLPSSSTLRVGQETLDRSPDAHADVRGDRLDRALSWRASGASLRWPLPGLVVTAAADYGEGREVVRIRRAETPYVDARGPVTTALASATLEAPRTPYRAKAWMGRWRGDAQAVVALWPFDALGAVAGSRQIANSNGALRHWGVSADRLVGRGAGIEGGLALWHVAPDAHYQSWRTTLFGVGRSDPTDGAVKVRSALAMGVRFAAVGHWGAAYARAEAVQWIPVRVVREASDETGAAPDPPPGSTPTSGSSTAERGGTVVRVSLGVGGD